MVLQSDSSKQRSYLAVVTPDPAAGRGVRGAPQMESFGGVFLLLRSSNRKIGRGRGSSVGIGARKVLQSAVRQ